MEVGIIAAIPFSGGKVDVWILIDKGVIPFTAIGKHPINQVSLKRRQHLFAAELYYSSFGTSKY